MARNTLNSWVPDSVTLIYPDKDTTSDNDVTRLCLELIARYNDYYQSKDICIVMSPSSLYHTDHTRYIYSTYMPEVINDIIKRQISLHKVLPFSHFTFNQIGHALVIIDDPKVSLPITELSKLLIDGKNYDITTIINMHSTPSLNPKLMPFVDYIFCFPYSRRYIPV